MSQTIATNTQKTKYITKITGMLTIKEQSHLQDLKMFQSLLPESQYKSWPGHETSSKLALFWIDKQNSAEIAITAENCRETHRNCSET